MEFETNGDHRGCLYVSRIAIGDRQGRVHIRTDVTIDLHDDATEAEQLAFRAISPHGSTNFVSELDDWEMSQAEAEIQAANVVRDRMDAFWGPTFPPTPGYFSLSRCARHAWRRRPPKAPEWVGQVDPGGPASQPGRPPSSP